MVTKEAALGGVAVVVGRVVDRVVAGTEAVQTAALLAELAAVAAVGVVKERARRLLMP